MASPVASNSISLVGIDCAAQHPNIGLARGVLDDSGLRVVEVAAGEANVLPTLRRWVTEHRPRVFALDAPLGWPEALGRSLNPHRAGELLEPPAHDLFRRETDKFVRRTLAKQPLEVGADRIARAAVTTLRVLDQLRRSTGLSLPLLWNPGVPEEPGVIEVYPAATLMAYGLSARGTKGRGPQRREAREALVERLAEVMNFELETEAMIATDHALDAAICLLAAADFVGRGVFEPEGVERDVLSKEGWIWVSRIDGEASPD